jgi:signal peptidase I
MVPAIQPGDMLTIQPVDSSEVALGDVVVYAKENVLVVHRVVRTCAGSSEARLVTRGDRLMQDDEPILPADLLGRVACIERKNRRMNVRTFSNWAEQALSLVLRRSERATYLFLRANELWGGLFSKGSL